LFEELNAELEKADQDDGIRAIVITGGEKVFAAGADIKEMKDKTCECDPMRIELMVGVKADIKRHVKGRWVTVRRSRTKDREERNMGNRSFFELKLTVTVAEAYRKNFLGSWGKLASIQKPIIGAVAGFAVGHIRRSARRLR
jgi:enoyl-CoA hydratase